MNIKFNEVTWYSKLLAVILFVAVAGLFFYFGGQFQEIRQNQRAQDELDKYAQSLVDESFKNSKQNIESIPKESGNNLSFTCSAGKKFNLEYFIVSNSPGPGEIYIPNDITSLDLKLSNGEIVKNLTFSKVSNGGHINQYLNENSTVLFQTDNDKAFLKQNGVITHKNCVVVE